jgi:hypothetical protein
MKVSKVGQIRLSNAAICSVQYEAENTDCFR